MTPFLCLIVSAQAGEFTSETQPILLEDSAELFTGVELDTDWLPSDSIMAVRFQVEADGGAEIQMEGNGDLSWPTDLTLSLTETLGSGLLILDGAVSGAVSLKFDIDVYSWESEVASESLEYSTEAAFDPFVLDGSKTDRVEVVGEDTPTTLFQFQYDVIEGIATVGFSAEMATENTTSFEGVAWLIDDLRVENAGQDVVFEPEPEPTAEFLTTFVGAWDANLSLVFTPIFEVCIESLGCYDWEVIDIDLSLLSEQFEQAFPSQSMSFPLPLLTHDIDMHDFGDQEVGSLANLQLPISNSGTLDLEGEVSIVGDEGFSVFPDYFQAGEGNTDGLVVSFSPLEEGAAHAVLVIDSNDPSTPQLRIPLSGAGVVTETAIDGPSEIVSSCGCSSPTRAAPAGVGLVFGAFGLAFVRRRGRH